jgi:hypothetical protein
MREKIITEMVEDSWLLVVIFDKQAHLGLIKVLTKRTTAILSNILGVARARADTTSLSMSQPFRRATVDTIDLVLRDDDQDERDEKSD